MAPFCLKRRLRGHFSAVTGAVLRPGSQRGDRLQNSCTKLFSRRRGVCLVPGLQRGKQKRALLGWRRVWAFGTCLSRCHSYVLSPVPLRAFDQTSRGSRCWVEGARRDTGAEETWVRVAGRLPSSPRPGRRLRRGGPSEGGPREHAVGPGAAAAGLDGSSAGRGSGWNPVSVGRGRCRPAPDSPSALVSTHAPSAAWSSAVPTPSTPGSKACVLSLIASNVLL